jgi:hypothetical protein
MNKQAEILGWDYSKGDYNGIADSYKAYARGMRRKRELKSNTAMLLAIFALFSILWVLSDYIL